MRRVIVGLTSAIAVAVALTGCGGTQDAQPAPAKATVASGPLTDAELLRISDAQQRLIWRCMKGKGFRYWEAERLSLEESRTLGYVTDDVDWAREHGYGSRIQAKEERARSDNPNAAYRATLSEKHRKAYDKALDDGVDAPVIAVKLPTGGTVRKQVGGCVAEAERRLYGDPETWFRAEKTVSSLQPLYVPQLMADQQFAQALTAWSQCMGRAGHPYKDPGEARRAGLQAALKSTSAETFEAERAIAVADAVCTRETSLRSLGNERETHYVNLLRDRYGKALDTYAQLQREALARAVETVGPRA